MAITGHGTLEGRGEIHFWNKNDGLEHPLFGQRYWPRLHRPKGLIHFRNSRNIVIRDITVTDPPCYNIWLLGCDNCELNGIKIRADLCGPNLDGIDLDCCSNVQVSRCDIICGDDGIAIKSDIHELGRDKACENIVISDCLIQATADGIRIGFEGDGAIRRILVNNCIIYKSMTGISLMVAISPNDIRGIDILKGAEITDISFDHLTIDALQTFNFQHPKCPPDTPCLIRGFMDRIFFRNITANATRGSFLGGAPESPIRTIEFSNLHMRLSGTMGTDFLHNVPDPYPLWSDLPYSGLPWPFYIRRAENAVFRNCTFSWENADGAWQNTPIKTENAKIVTENIRMQNPPEEKMEQDLIFPIGNHKGVPYFLPPVGFEMEKELRKVSEYKLQTEDFLKTSSWCPAKKITASFVYARPADYMGRNMLKANVQDWIRAFRRFKEIHIDTVIFQAALWKELKQCFYHSNRYTDMECYPVIERMLEAASLEKIQVFLGGYGSTSGWKESLSDCELKNELAEYRHCFNELLELGQFSGVYFPSETAFRGCRLPPKEKNMHRIYESFVDMIKSQNSALKVLISPATQHNPEQNDMFVEFWNNILSGCGIDILLPQDSIGTQGCRLSDMHSIWQKWKEIADSQKMNLWSHIELFERRDYSFTRGLAPASPERVAAQIQLTEQFVSRYCCWEALYFPSEKAGENGSSLHQFMKDGSISSDCGQ